jgi:hypothetical protein
VLTPIADVVVVHRSELLQNLTVVVRGRAMVVPRFDIRRCPRMLRR